MLSPVSLAAMRAAVSPSALLLGATGLIVGGSLFWGGAAGEGSVIWVGGAAVVAVGLAFSAAAVGLVRLPRLDGAALAALGLLAAFAGWSGLSIWWSTQPARSWDSFNRAAAYVAVAALATIAAASAPRAARTAAAGLTGLLALVLLWALLGKVVPGFGPDARIARLRSPVGYWNELALLADGAVALGLWLAGRRRVVGVALLYVACVAAVLTYSRSGIALGLLVAVAWIALRPERTQGLLGLAVAGVAAGVACSVAFALPGVTTAGAGHAERVRDGAIFGAVLVVLGAAAVLGGRWVLARRLDARAERRILRAGAAAAVAALVVGLAAGIAVAGGPVGFVQSRWDEFTSPSQFSNGAGRVTSVSSGGRWQWWKEAWGAFVDHPGGGTGAGTFQLSDLRRRRSAVTTIEPHNTALQFLSETGLVGFGLWLGAAVAAAVAIRRRRYDDPAAAAALGLLAAAFFAHSLVDIDWTFLATQVPLFAALGALLGAGTPEVVARPSRLRAAAVVLVAAGIAYSLAAPWLAQRKTNASLDALVRLDFPAAAERAQAARSLNPLSVPAVTYEAQAEEGRGNLLQAYALYIKAVRLEPENGETWFNLGAFQLERLRNSRAAFDSLNRAYTLDPLGEAGKPGGLLDQARCRAFHRLCGRVRPKKP